MGVGLPTRCQPRMRARGFAAQQTEAAIGAVVLAGCWQLDARIPAAASHSSHSGLDLGPTHPGSVKCTNADFRHFAHWKSERRSSAHQPS